MKPNQEDLELQQPTVVEITPKKSKISAYRGLILSLCCSILYSAAFVIVKQLKNIPPGQLAVYRFLSSIFFSFPQAVKCEENLLGPKNLRFLLILRSVSSSSSLFFSFYAVRYLPLGEASAILCCSPIFVTIAGRIFLKEHYGKLQFLTVLMSVAGIFLITKVPQKLAGSSVIYTTETVYGFISAATSLCFLVSFSILTRKVKGVHHSIQMCSFGFVGVLEMVVLTAIFGNFQLHNCGLQILYIIALCLLGFINASLVIMALQCEMAGPVVTILNAANVAFAFVWQILLFDDISDIYTSFGAVLIVISGILIGIIKHLSLLPLDSNCRKKFDWMIR